MTRRPTEADPVEELAAVVVDRLLEELGAIIKAHPEKRREVAMHALLGAVALGDAMGVPVETWLGGLRAMQARERALVPPQPKGAAS